MKFFGQSAGDPKGGSRGETAKPSVIRVRAIARTPSQCPQFGHACFTHTCSAPGFATFIKPHVESPYYPHAGVAEERKAFRSLHLASLKSSDPCIQMAAVILLRDIADERAIEPLLDLLKQDNGSSWAPREARMALVSTFKCPLVVPYIVQVLVPPAMDPENVGIDVQALREGIKDPRLFDALYTLFHTPNLKPMNKGLVLEVLVSQRYGPECDGRLYQIFEEIKKNPDVFILRRGAAPHHCHRQREDLRRARIILLRAARISNIKIWMAVPLRPQEGRRRQVPGFSKKATVPPQERTAQKKWASRELFEELKKRVEPETPVGKDSLDWIKEQAGDMAPDGARENLFGPYWRQALRAVPRPKPLGGRPTGKGRHALFTRNTQMESSIQWKLCGIYGPEGTDEPEKKLKALTAAIDNYTESLKGVTREQGRQPNDWVYGDSAQAPNRSPGPEGLHPDCRRRASRVGEPAWWLESGINAAGRPVQAGGLPRDPVGYIDYFGREGLLVSVPATVAIDLGPSELERFPSQLILNRYQLFRKRTLYAFVLGFSSCPARRASLGRYS